MSFWRTLVLLALAAGLGTYIFFVEQPRIEEEAAPDRLVAFDASDVQTLTLAYPGADLITLERSDDGWQMLAPAHFPADDEVVDRLIEQIAGATVDRRIPMGEVQSLTEYGLDGDGEQAKLTFGLAGGLPAPDVIVGRTTPVGYQAFARLADSDEIVITPLIFHTGVKKTAFELRDKSLFDVPQQSVISANIFNAGTTIALERNGDEWKLTEPVRGVAARDQIEGLIAALNSMTALEFLDTPPPDETTGLDIPTAAFSVETGDGTRHGFTLGKRLNGPPPSYYLRRDDDGLVAKIDEAARVRFDKDTNTLRDKQMFRCTAEEIERMRFDRSDGEGFELFLNDDQAWTVSPMPPDSLVRDGIIKRTRSALASLQASEVVAESAETPEELGIFGLNEPQIVVTLVGRDKKPCGRVIASVLDAESDTPKHYVAREGSPIVFTMPSYHYSRLDTRPGDFVAAAQDGK